MLMLGLYVDYSCNALGYICAISQAYLFRAYANNMKCMYMSVSGHIVDAVSSYEVYMLT